MGKSESHVSRLIDNARCRAFQTAVIVLAWCPQAVTAQQPVWISGIQFQQQNGKWVQLDPSGEPWEIRSGRILVRFEGENSGISLNALLAAGLVPVSSTAYPGRYFPFSYEDSLSPPAILERTLGVEGVSNAYLDTRLKFYGEPDTYIANQWNLTKTRVDRAWSITAGDSTVIIAVLDKGFEIGHEDLAECIWVNDAEVAGQPGVDDDHNGCIDDFHGCDFASNADNPSSDHDPSPEVYGDEHGTAVAGIASAVRNNGKGVAGVCGGTDQNRPKLLPIRINWASDWSRALRYVLRIGVDVVNMSGGGYSDPDGVCAALIDSAYANGTVFLAAIGNNGNDANTMFPATLANVIAVGATDENDVKTCSSNYGAFLDIMAPSTTSAFWPPSCDPGPYIWTTDNSGQIGFNPGFPNCLYCASDPPENPNYWARFDGTSAACPLAAGIAVLLKSHFPTLTSSQIRARLENSAVDLGAAGWDAYYGHGRVDAYRALTEWGTITGNVTWSPSDTHNRVRYVSGDLTIAPGATLTIMPGTVVRIADDDDLQAGADVARVEIIVKGTLIANGTAVSPIVFERWGTAGEWAGIYFDPTSAGGTFDYCQISHAETGIESYAPLTVTNSLIYDCTNSGVVSLAGGALVYNCQLNSPGHIGIDLRSDEAVVRSTIVDSAADYAVRVSALTAATLTLRNSEFDNSGIGLFVDGNATVSVDSTCFFYQNDTGIHLYDSGSAVTIRDCGITWNPSGGIVCDGSSAPLIQSNIIAHNGGGIYCSNYSSPRIEKNQIQGPGNAIAVVSDAVPDIGHSSPSGNQSIGDNKVSQATKFVANSTSATIYAQHNCWNVNVGGCSPPSSKFTGSVDRSDPICCSFPPFSHGEGEPTPSEGFVFQADPTSPREPEKRMTTGLVAIVPNPFNPITTIRYSMASQGKVEINVYDVGGRLVQTLANETQVAGHHAVEWKGTDRAGAPVASGIYFVRMVANGQTFTMKMALLK